MKKKTKIILIAITSFIVLYGVIFLTDMSRVKQLKKPIFCIENGYMGSMTRFDGLGYKIGLDINATTGEITYGQMTMLGQFIVKLYKEEEDSPAEVNNFIIDYFSKEKSDNSNLVFNYVDDENKVVVVGLLDNSDKKQEEFIYNVFSNCCGSTYIKYIKDNNLIKFEKAVPNQNLN